MLHLMIDDSIFGQKKCLLGKCFDNAHSLGWGAKRASVGFDLDSPLLAACFWSYWTDVVVGIPTESE